MQKNILQSSQSSFWLTIRNRYLKDILFIDLSNFQYYLTDLWNFNSAETSCLWYTAKTDIVLRLNFYSFVVWFQMCPLSKLTLPRGEKEGSGS
jgi:hypothetical protein